MGKRAGRPSKKHLEITERLQSFKPLAVNGKGHKKIAKQEFPTKTLELAASKIEGGKRAFVEYVRMAVDSTPELKPFMELWDSQTEYARARCTLDEMANLASVKPGALVAAAASSAYQFNADISDLMAMSALPDVVRSGIKVATGDSELSYKDREMLYKHARFIPTPAGSVINISNSNQAAANANAQAGVMPFSDSVSALSGPIRDAWVPPEDGE